MRYNPYNNKAFFDKYSKMTRSVKGLEGAGEWETLKKMLPDFKGKKVLDLGCGFGWHCQYAIEHGAKSVTGVDISVKMLDVAKQKTSNKIEYILSSINNIKFSQRTFDIVISSLAFHYLESFEEIAKKVSNWITQKGNFVFSVEHPIFTAYGTQDWYRDKNGEILHFPVDNYFYESKREAVFLEEKVSKYHKTITTYINTLILNGFEITGVVEPKGIGDELRRPMMLIISARKK